MRIRFWGTRGSLPIALTASDVRDKVVTALRRASGRVFESDEALSRFVDTLGPTVSGTFGGHSACVEIETGGAEYVLCDMGSGVRAFGQAALARHGPTTPRTYHVFMSHVHWDHIMGFPFFTPAYLPGNTIRIYGGHPELEQAFRRQQAPPSFPVPFISLGATIEFKHLAPGERYEIAGMQVMLKRQRHPGASYGYRFEAGGRSVIYSTDSEHKLEVAGESDGFVEFFRDADLVIFDAMYSLADAIEMKADWGHSSNVVGVELCQRAGVRHLCLFHHEPTSNDERLARMLADTKRLEEITRRDGRPLNISAAYDGMEIDL